jgi:hypothetical protein
MTQMDQGAITKPAECSDAEWEMRCDLAECYHLI